MSCLADHLAYIAEIASKNARRVRCWAIDALGFRQLAFRLASCGITASVFLADEGSGPRSGRR